jgi:hypothetical protein
VSWGHDGAIRFWSLTGEPCSGGDPRAHEGGVRGVLPVADGLLSWGGSGVFRRWTRDGKSVARCWIVPVPFEIAALSVTAVWVGLLGRLHRLVFDVV